MKRLLLLLALLLALALPARATFVQGNHLDFATAASTACATGTVTSGNVEIMAVQANTGTTVTISSTRVTTWVRDQAIVNGLSGVSTYLWHGAITSSGAETVTVSLTSGTATIGSACLEYSGTVNLDAATGGVNSTLSLTTVATTTTVIEAGTFSGGGTSASSPFTNRQQISLSGTQYFAVGDVNETSQGAYSAAFTGSGTAILMMESLTASAPVASTYVQSSAGNGGSGTSQTCTFPKNVASGDMLVVGTKNNGAASISSVADSLGTAWTTDASGAGGTNVGYYHGTATSSGADTITVTWSSAILGIVVCGEYTRPNKDVFNTTSAASSVAVTTTHPITTLVYIVGDGQTLLISSPFNTRITGGMQTAPIGLLMLGDLAETSTGTYTASSNAGASGNNALGAFFPTAPPNVPRHR